MSPIIHDFNFIGFEPTEELKKRAYLASERLLDLSPYGSMVVALLQKDDLSYRCAIEIYSKYGPFIGQSSDEDPEIALKNAVRFISKRLDHWKQRRGLSAPLGVMQGLKSVA